MNDLADAMRAKENGVGHTYSSSLSSPSTTRHSLVINPYAAKRPAAALYSGPLHTFGAKESTASSTYLLALDDHVSSRQSSSSVDDDGDLKPAAAVASPLENSKEQLPQLQAMSAPDLPQWQRLPSRHLSFGSAETLTVPECASLLRSSTVQDEGKSKSVSVTGVIRYIVTHNQQYQAVGNMATDDDSNSTRIVSLVLGDPLAPLINKKNSTRMSLGPRRVSTTPARPRGTLLSSTTTATSSKTTTNLHKTPLLASRRISGSSLVSSVGHLSTTTSSNSVIAPTPARPSGLLGKKRSFRSVSRTSRSSLLLNHNRRCRRRPHQPPDPMEQLVSELTKPDAAATSVWVQADPTIVPVYSFQVGQLLTVMGELTIKDGKEGDKATDNNEDTNDDDAMQCDDETETTLAPTLTTAPNSDAADKGDDETGSESIPLANSIPQMAWIRARILRNATGTNMKLYTDALMVRRKMLEQIR